MDIFIEKSGESYIMNTEESPTTILITDEIKAVFQKRFPDHNLFWIEECLERKEIKTGIPLNHKAVEWRGRTDGFIPKFARYILTLYISNTEKNRIIAVIRRIFDQEKTTRGDFIYAAMNEMIEAAKEIIRKKNLSGGLIKEAQDGKISG